MVFEFKKAKWSKDSDGVWLMLLAPEGKTIEFISNMADKLYSCTIQLFRKKRSPDANSYFWVLVNELSNVLRIGKDECYLMMLKRYGQVTVVSVLEEAAEMLKRSVKYCEVFGNGLLNGKKFVHFKIYMGSSEMDSREMAVLIDGIISECKEQGIDTISKTELDILKGEWKQ